MRGKEIIYFILLVILVGGGIYGITTVKAWYVGYQLSKQQAQDIKATGGMIADGVQADEDRAERDTGLAQARQDFHDRYQEDERHEPAIADRSDRAVPQRVRDNFHARRLARQRLGCAGSECEPRSEDDAAAER